MVPGLRRGSIQFLSLQVSTLSLFAWSASSFRTEQINAQSDASDSSSGIFRDPEAEPREEKK